MFGANEIINLADKVGAIDAIKYRLLNQPDKAAAKLADSLDELYKTFKALDEEIVRYLSLYFDSEATIIQGRAVLLGMEVGQSRIRMHEARGHCAKIKNIYQKHLNGWFDRVFKNETDNKDLKNFFEDIGTADDAIIQAVDKVTDWLTKEAEQTLDLVDGGNRLGANQRVTQARIDAKPARIRMTEAMAHLRGMQAEFIASSKTV